MYVSPAVHAVSSVAEWRGDVRLNGDTLEALVRARLISVPQLDAQLALAMEAGNYSSVFLVMQLLQVSPVSQNWLIWVGNHTH